MVAAGILVLSAAALVGHTAAVVVSAQAPQAFQASENPGTVVIQLTQDVGVEGDDTPLLRIYGDGRVLVHFPVYMRRAGDYGLRLDSTELDGLLQTFVQGGLVDFSVERVREEIRQVRDARRRAALDTGGRLTLTTRSDEAVVVIDVRLERYTGADGAVRQDVEARVSSAGLQFDAANLPGVASLQSLAAIERQLIALTSHPDLVRVAP